MPELTISTPVGFALTSSMELWLETLKARGFDILKPITMTLNKDKMRLGFKQGDK